MPAKTFSYEEAIALLPTVRDLTDAAVERVRELLDGREEAEETDEIPDDLIDDYQKIVYEWAESIQALGVEVKGLWLVDFDCGSGYYCWRHPEPALQYFHGYDEGFQGRVLLT